MTIILQPTVRKALVAVAAITLTACAGLHPAILSAMAGALPDGPAPRLVALHSHATAARLAALDDPILRRLPDSFPPTQEQT